MENSKSPKDIQPGRRELPARMRGPRPEDITLLAEADRHLRLSPNDAEVREAREKLPELGQSE